jgi:glycosyltransferase involved in cell wall biosynthesis
VTRLSLVLTEWPPAVGGMQTHARHLAAHLARRGHAVEVLTYRITDAVLQEEARAFDERQPFPVRRILSRLGYWHNVALIRQRVREFRAEAVYASTVFYGHLRSHAQVPVVCRCVGNDVLRPWLGYPYPWPSRAIGSAPLQRGLRWWLEHGQHPDWVDRVFRASRERLMREAAAGHSGILANSQYTADLLGRIGIASERIEVVGGGVDSQRFAPPSDSKRAAREALGIDPRDLVVLTVCRLVEKKGVEVLLDATARLRVAFPRLKLVIVGDGRKRRVYEACAAALGLQGAIRFEGRVPHERIAHHFWAADVFALASYESRHADGQVRDVETMGRVLCEANAAGVALVATRTGGTPSIVRDGGNGLLVPPGDAQAMANAIARVLRHNELRAGLVASGLELARREFDWSAVMARNEAAIDLALTRSA